MVIRASAALALLAILSFDAPSQAQTPAPPDARLQITVVDPSSAVIPGATVTVAGLEADTRNLTLPPATTSAQGTTTFEGLVPGRYRVEAEFPGFERGTLADIRLRRGDNKHVVVLSLRNMQEEVTVAQNAQAAAADPRGNSFKAVLAPEEIDALSDDPAEMAQQLIDMTGGNALIRVDSFAGAPLPPKALIKSIHIVRDAFAAENHSAESEEIQIITQPGQGALRGSFTSRIRDGSMNARSPFTATKGPERTQNYEANIGGTLIRNRSSFSLSISNRDAFDTPNLNAQLPDGRRSETLNARRSNDGWSLYGLLDYALTRDQTLRLSYDQSSSTRDNLGIGGWDLPSRAYSTKSDDHELRAQVVGPLGRRVFANTRLQLDWQSNVSRSAVDEPTIRVIEEFTSGGAQVAGGRHPKNLEFASDIDYVRGIHTARGGVLIDGGRYRSDDSANMLGTYTFSSLEDYELGVARTYTRRIGDPLVEYQNVQAGAYIQDDIRVRKNLTLSPGLRYEAQTHVNDFGNLGPRLGMTWAPFRSGKTTIRGSVGIFYNWLNTGTFEQTLRVDGFRQRELNIVNPSYPNPGNVGTIPATNRYLLGDAVEMPTTVRVSAGIDQTITPQIRVSATYSTVRGSSLFRGRNLNAPVNGVRRDPAFANEIEVVSDARSISDQLATNVTMNFAAGVRNAGLPRWNLRRTTIRFSYWLSEANNNSDGAFSVPATGTLATEWGPAPQDRRHRVSATLSTQALKRFSANLSLAANSGAPYTITTGFDDNGDSIFNDRPVGVGRNSIRTPSQATLSANFSYSIGLGLAQPRAAAAMQERDRPGAAQPSARYRLVFTLSANNLTNHANYGGYSGAMTSSFFRQATNVANPRKIDLGVSIRF